MRHDTILRGSRVRLVPYTRAHVAAYSEWMQDPELLRLTGSEPLSYDEELANQVSWTEDPHKVTFIVCALDEVGGGAAADGVPGDDLTQGMCGDVNAFLSPLEADDDDDDGGGGAVASDALSAELEVMIAVPDRRRGGLAREALTLFVDWLLARAPAIARLVVKVTDDNAASLGLFASLGFAVHKHLTFFEQTELRRPADAAREEARRACVAAGATASAAVGAEEAAVLAARLERTGRNAFVSEVREQRGLDVGRAAALADALRLVPHERRLDGAFEDAAAAMPPLLRAPQRHATHGAHRSRGASRAQGAPLTSTASSLSLCVCAAGGLLVENADPAGVGVEELLATLGRDDEPGRLAAAEGDVMHAAGALSRRACAALRSAVDCSRRLEADSVDRQSQSHSAQIPARSAHTDSQSVRCTVHH